MPYDLLEDIKGLKKGRKKKVKKKFPEDHQNPDLRGKKITFEIELEEIKEMKLPPLTEDIAKELGCESVDDLKRKHRQNLGDLHQEPQKRSKSKSSTKLPYGEKHF